MAGTASQGTPTGSVSRVAPRGRRHELLSLWGLRFSTEWTRLTWAAGWSPTGRMILALNCSQWHVPPPAPMLGWDVESRCWRGAPGAAQLFPPHQWFWRLVLSALFWSSCCVESLLWGFCFVVGAGVGASRGVPAFKRARGLPPGGPEDRPSLQKWTSLLDYRSEPVNSVLPSKTHQVDQQMLLWTFGPDNLTLKIFHLVVNLIFSPQERQGLSSQRCQTPRISRALLPRRVQWNSPMETFPSQDRTRLGKMARFTNTHMCKLLYSRVQKF